MYFDEWGITLLERLTEAIVTFAATTKLYGRARNNIAMREVDYTITRYFRESAYQASFAHAMSLLHRQKHGLIHLSRRLQELTVTGSKSDPMINRFITSARNSIVECGEHIGELLEDNKLEGQEIDLREVLEKLVREMRQLTESVNTKVRVDAVAGERYAVWCRKSVARNAFAELIFNALEAIRRANRAMGVITLSLRRIDESADTWVQVSLSDNGDGMEEHRIVSMISRGVSGGRSSGLGMIFVRTNIQLFGGSIAFESQLTRGTTVHVLFPESVGAMKSGGVGVGSR